MKPLSAIPAGAAVFIDANVFVYHFIFIGHSQFGTACTELLERVQAGEVEGWTSSHILAEVAHRLMTIEACAAFGWPYEGIAARLRSHRADINQLAKSRQAILEIGSLGLRIAGLGYSDVVDATQLSQQWGLLTNDALIVALMNSHHVPAIASSDADFDAVATIERFAPR